MISGEKKMKVTVQRTRSVLVAESSGRTFTLVGDTGPSVSIQSEIPSEINFVNKLRPLAQWRN